MCDNKEKVKFFGMIVKPSSSNYPQYKILEILFLHEQQ